MDGISFEIREHVATLSLLNPASDNALTLDMCMGLPKILRDVKKSDARCVLLKGVGSSFCAGDALSESPEFREEALPRAIRKWVNPLLQGVLDLRQPVIALLHGDVMGLGLGLSLAADVRIATEETRIAVTPKRGQLFAPGFGWLLPRIAGYSVAALLAFNPEPVDGRWAFDHGLVSELVEAGSLDSHGEAIAARVGSQPVEILSAHKQSLAQSPALRFDESLEYEAYTQDIVADIRLSAKNKMRDSV